jgi:indolepyruvate ferredoxin oxidoreductase
VTSHIRLAPTPDALHAVRVGAGAADLVLGCDMTVAASPATLSRMQPGRTRAVVNASVVPTAAFVIDTNIDLAERAMRDALARAAGREGVEFVAAAELATALMGDAIATNLFMLGYALQRGLVPLSLASILQAITLNGTAVESSKAALDWGRLAAHDPDAVRRAAGVSRSAEASAPATFEALVEDRMRRLTEYQDAAYAERYRRTVARLTEAEQRALGSATIADAAARSLYKLMAYKDEYEVARLYTNGAFAQRLRAQFDGDYALQFHLAPPLLARVDPLTGEPKKRTYGPWMLKAFGELAKLRRLRGTALDPFGRTEERRMERTLIERYEALFAQMASNLRADNASIALEIAELPQEIRGFGHVKANNAAAAETRLAALLAAFAQAPALPSAKAERATAAG